jgi:hypothetical protein
MRRSGVSLSASFSLSDAPGREAWIYHGAEPLLRAQARLKITPVEMNVIMQMVEHWWHADSDPWPKKETIALRMRKSPRMIQRYITSLEKKGIVTRVERFKGKKRQTSNAYSLAGLVKKLILLEPEFKKERDQNRIRAKKFETVQAS